MFATRRLTCDFKFLVLLLVSLLGNVETKKFHYELLEDPPDPVDIAILVGGRVYTPDFMPDTTVVISGTKILGMIPASETSSFIDGACRVTGIECGVFDVSGHYVIPGLVDVHVHAAGAGGELGPYSRTPEAPLSDFIINGITTIVGLLGTDGIGRGLESVLMKLKGLNHDGITAYMWTGFYRSASIHTKPQNTLTESLMGDIMYIQEVIGQKVAVQDHRSTFPGFTELKEAWSDCYTSGLLSGKSGVLYAHMGEAETGLKPFFEILDATTLPITSVYPTHLGGRGRPLIEDTKEWIARGGYGDFSANSATSNTTIDTITEFLDEGLDISHVTISSDAYGSMPRFENGVIVGYGIGRPDSLLRTIKQLVQEREWDISDAIRFSTINPADFLSFPNGKGTLQQGGDADIVVLTTDFEVEYVWGRGEILKTPTWIKRGLFEEDCDEIKSK